jgi:hypothetical protein
VARDWEMSNTLASLLERMAKFGNNVAPVPLCITLELREGVPVYVVDLHIKVIRTTEFDLTAEATTLSGALRSAYLGLNNERGLVERAAESNLAFGVAI